MRWTALARVEIAATAGVLVFAALIVIEPALFDHWRLATGAALVGLSLWIAVVDLSTFTIPDAASASMAIIGAAWRVSRRGGIPGDWLSELTVLAIEAAAVGLAFWGLRELYFRRRGVDGLGFGDVKLAAACAIVLGSTLFAWALLAASLAALAAAFVGHAVSGRHIARRIAFGAFLAPCCALLWIFSQWPDLLPSGFGLFEQAGP